MCRKDVTVGVQLCTNILQKSKRKQEVDGSGNPIPGAKDQQQARRLILMADNYNENKCNTEFAFLSHLIFLHLFNAVELLFASVDHTHNGNDFEHKVHKNVAGDTVSETLGDFCHKFTTAQNNAAARPQPFYMDITYNRDTSYQNAI